MNGSHQYDKVKRNMSVTNMTRDKMSTLWIDLLVILLAKVGYEYMSCSREEIFVFCPRLT